MHSLLTNVTPRYVRLLVLGYFVAGLLDERRRDGTRRMPTDDAKRYEQFGTMA